LPPIDTSNGGPPYRAPHWLVVRGGALGDFVVTVPAIEAVRARAGRLTLVADPRFAAPWPDLADEIVDVRGRDALWLFGDLPAPFVPDAALVYTPGVADRLKTLGVPTVLTAPPMPVRRAHEHFFEPLGGRAPAPRVVPDPALAFPHAIVLAPGAGSTTKVWPGFDALAEELTARNLSWRFLVGPDDPPRPDAWSGLSLTEVAALASQSLVWVGNDSGTTHLAAAAGARVVAMFGPTDPAVWGPPNATILGFRTTPTDVARTVARMAAEADIRLPHSKKGTA
jgi:heptosyltransferase III